jgi:hypothetical protein
MVRELHEVVLTGMGCITARGATDVAKTRQSTMTHERSPCLNSSWKIMLSHPPQKTYLDRCSALALAVCALALRDAGLSGPLNDDIVLTTRVRHHTCTPSSCTKPESVLGQATERAQSGQSAVVFPFYFITPILCAPSSSFEGYHTTYCAGTQSGIGGGSCRAWRHSTRPRRDDALRRS